MDAKPAKVRSPFGYKVSLCLVAMTMLLLPIIYLAFTVFAGWLTVMVAIYCYPGFDAEIFRLLGWPLLISIPGCFFFFLVRPIFQSFTYEEESITKLPPGHEPAFEALVKEIARAVNAPEPKEICFDTRANASASLRGGLAGIFGSDLRLTIGLPLVYGLSSRSLAGIIAHELGHFGQRGGMRFSAIIGQIQFWFSRVVYTRGAMESWLERLTYTRLFFIVLPVRLAIWLVRKILFALMYFGNIISQFSSRQAEFDADKYEVHIAGSDQFPITCGELAKFYAAERKTNDLAGQSSRARRLPNNFPLLMASEKANLPAGQAESLAKMQSQERKIGLFSSHPSNKARIDRASKNQSPGIYLDESPAHELFRSLRGLSESATRAFYGTFGGDGPPPELYDNSELEQQGFASKGGESAIAKFYFNLLDSAFPLTVSREEMAYCFNQLPASAEQLRALAKIAKEQRNALDAKHDTLMGIQGRLIDLRIAEHHISTGLGLATPAAFGMNTGTLREVQELTTTTKTKRNEALAELEPLRSAIRHRLGMALSATFMESLQADDTRRDEVIRLCTAMAALGEILNDLRRLRERYIAISEVARGDLSIEELPEKLSKKIYSETSALTGLATSIRRKIADVPWPLDGGHETIGQALSVPDHSALDRHRRDLAESCDMFNLIGDLHDRIMGRLAVIADENEEALEKLESESDAAVAA